MDADNSFDIFVDYNVDIDTNHRINSDLYGCTCIAI